MKIIHRIFLSVSALSLLLSLLPQYASAQQAISAKQIVSNYYEAFYSPGNDMWVKVTMDLISKDGKRRKRQMVMLRKDIGDQEDQKYFTYFNEPGDVRRTAFLVWKYPGKDDERWIFIPAVDLVKKVAAEDKRSSFIGSDFTYEDVSGRDVESDNHTLLKYEKMNDRDCYVIESKPLDKVDYTKRISWIDTKTYLPIKEEYYDQQNQLYKVFTADEIKEIPAGETGAMILTTITKRTMRNVKTGHSTEVVFSDVKYNTGVEENVFTERSLRTPPAKWIK
ncbi:MAG: outer membrane lipoprotein-sorting protein [Acidobacteriota bacterium]